MQRATAVVDVAAIGQNVQHFHFAAEAPKELRCNRSRGSVRAVGHNVQSCQVQSRNRIDDELNVIELQRVIVFHRGQRGRIGRRRQPGVMQNLFFHRQLHRIRQLEPVASKQLDAVVAPGIVRCGDHNARGKSVRTRQKRHGWRRHYSRALHSGARLAQPGSQRRRNPRA
jgi:hypothetical protein